MLTGVLLVYVRKQSEIIVDKVGVLCTVVHMKYTLLLSVMFSFCTQSVIGQEKKVLPKGWDDIDPIDITEFWVKLPKIHPKDNAIDGLYEISQKIEKIPGYVELEKILADHGRTVKELENLNNKKHRFNPPRVSIGSLEVEFNCAETK